MPDEKEKTPEYNQLLKDYRDLQLRITRFSYVEQQLINTRDRLDHELELYKRLHKFNSGALQEQSDSEFAKLITEAIIDIFEVESAIFYFEKSSGVQERYLSVEGITKVANLETTLVKELEDLTNAWKDQRRLILQRQHLASSPTLNKYDEGLFFSFSDPYFGYTVYMMGLISIEHAPLYQKLQSRHETIFGVFVQQVQSLVANRQKSGRIREQVKRISASELELRKLSFIATKTKNGVIITDANGKIEWVNESFVKTTGYESSEVIGKDAINYLHRSGLNSAPDQQLQDAFIHREFVELTLENFNRDGAIYYNQLEITPVFNADNELVNYIALQKDITAETMFRQEIMRINSRFELITAKSEIGIWEWQPKIRKLMWNEVLLDQFGIKKDVTDRELYPLWRHVLYPDDIEKLEDEVKRLIFQKGEMVELEFRITRVDNREPRIMKCLIIAEHDASEELVRLIGTSIDITENREAELKLKASEEKYRSIIENMNLGLVEVDFKGNVVFSNKKFHDLTFLSDPSVLINAQHGERFDRPDKLEFNVLSYRKIADSVFEIEFRRIDHRLVTLLESTAPVYDQQNNITGHISIYLDISSVKLLQKNLEEAVMERDSFIRKVNSLKLFYEGILNHSPAEIFVINSELTLTYVNRLFVENEAGIHREIGNGLNEIAQSRQFSKEKWEVLIDKIKESLEEGALVQFEEIRHLENGEERNILRNILPNYNDKGVLEHIVVSGVDITDLKRVQADVVNKNVELKKINAELDNFVYSISHDLRSPLLSIKGILDLIIEKGGLDENNLRYIQMADLSAGRLDGTIQEILEYSRNARLELKLTEFDVKEMINSIFDDLRFSDPEEIKFELNIEGPPLLFSDKYRVNTLLKNIIGNSVKYKRSHIPDSFVRVYVFREANNIVIKVVDNGEGISEKNIDKIFDMFYRGTSKSVGTGLGLYICKEILIKLSGTVDVESVRGEGTTMKLTLPLSQPN